MTKRLRISRLFWTLSAAALALTGCSRNVPPTRAQVATVRQAVMACTAASAKLTDALRAGDRIGSANVAVDARNACTQSRAVIAGATQGNPLFDPCRETVDAQIAVHRRELSMLDAPTPENGRAVLAQLDQAIRSQHQCATALDTLR